MDGWVWQEAEVLLVLDRVEVVVVVQDEEQDQQSVLCMVDDWAHDGQSEAADDADELDAESDEEICKT